MCKKEAQKQKMKITIAHLPHNIQNVFEFTVGSGTPLTIQAYNI